MLPFLLRRASTRGACFLHRSSALTRGQVPALTPVSRHRWHSLVSQGHVPQSARSSPSGLERVRTGEEGRRKLDRLGLRPLATAAEGYESLTVAQLKHFLDSAGIDYRDCYEKRELVDRLSSAEHSLSPHLRSDLEALVSRGGREVRPQSPSHSGLLQEEQRTIEVFDRSAPSVVHITTSSLVQQQFSLDISEIPLGTGSGFVWDQAGHIVTNYHVVRNAQKAKVNLADNTSFEAKLVGAEPDKDLAVLRIDTVTKGKTLVPLSIGSSHSLRVGQKVYAIGNPFGLDQTLTTGIVSGVGRDIKGITGRPIRGVVQTDAAINPGNSGGPLLDSQGKLIGVNTMILSPSGASSGVGFAVPADTVRRVVNQIIRHGKVIKPSLGVNCAADQQARQLGLAGVLVLSVVPGSGADRAGLLGTSRSSWGEVTLGDEIVKVNGKDVSSAEDIISVLELCDVGTSAQVAVRRKGKMVTIDVVLQARAE
ncbi:peptidase [Chloropicon primus]|uniref:Peptidase n=1 Tax=Chloropicon primus TaxID=1764295 RepID=A0A5B8MPW5_9CHLO|nr:peptidase [Chloropicon primus]UPR01698.1 peptidase [Chloropicon primus]|eukprot:QDZ22477.1 peptidase [Chloropicon primus]